LRRIVPRIEIIQARFGVAFFPRKFVSSRADPAASIVFTERKKVHRLTYGAADVGHQPSRTQMILVHEVRGAASIFGKKPSVQIYITGCHGRSLRLTEHIP